MRCSIEIHNAVGHPSGARYCHICGGILISTPPSQLKSTSPSLKPQTITVLCVLLQIAIGPILFIPLALVPSSAGVWIFLVAAPTAIGLISFLYRNKSAVLMTGSILFGLYISGVALLCSSTVGRGFFSYIFSFIMGFLLARVMSFPGRWLQRLADGCDENDTIWWTFGFVTFLAVIFIIIQADVF